MKLQLWSQAEGLTADTVETLEPFDVTVSWQVPGQGEFWVVVGQAAAEVHDGPKEKRRFLTCNRVYYEDATKGFILSRPTNFRWPSGDEGCARNWQLSADQKLV